jgi:hypothetical protein
MEVCSPHQDSGKLGSLAPDLCGILSNTVLSDLASDQYSWVQTSGSAGFRNTQPPIGDLVWATVATADATSWLHVDSEGFATSSQLLVGAKYWVVFYGNPSIPSDFGGGNMASVKFKDFCDWDSHVLKNSFCAEAVLLRPRMIL